jgi:hypothetical protein
MTPQVQRRPQEQGQERGQARRKMPQQKQRRVRYCRLEKKKRVRVARSVAGLRVERQSESRAEEHQALQQHQLETPQPQRQKRQSEWPWIRNSSGGAEKREKEARAEHTTTTNRMHSMRRWNANHCNPLAHGRRDVAVRFPTIIFLTIRIESHFMCSKLARPQQQSHSHPN